MLQPTSRRLVAILFLGLNVWGSVAVMGTGATALLLPQPAEAQEGGGGGLLKGLLGGDGGGILPLLLIIMMLMQLFGGGQGGNTPQKNAPVEERPPLPANIGPQQTGPRSGVAPPALPPAAILPVQPPVSAPLPIPPALPPSTTVSSAPILVFQIPTGSDSAALSPNTVTIQTDTAVTVVNTATVPASMTVRRAGQTASLAQISVAAGTSHRIRFQKAGTFELVSGTKILGTVTVR